MALSGRGDSDPAIVSAALALGRNLGVVFKENVDDTPLGRVHWRQLDGTALSNGASRGPVGHALDGLDAALAVALRVQDDSLHEGPFPVYTRVDQILQGVDGLALLTDEQGSVIRGDVHGDEASRVVDVYPRLETHRFGDGGYQALDLVQQFFRDGGVFALGRLSEHRRELVANLGR